MKTLDRIRAAGIVIPPLDMRLEKRVPPGTGLGGGSGDAAALLDYLASAGYPVERFAAEIGADVPFLLSRVPVALARGAGEKLSPLQAPSAQWRVVVVIPTWRCVTADMFARLDKYFHDEWKSTSEQACSEARQVFDRLVRGEFCGLLPNDFSDLLLRERGEYRALFADFCRTGAIAWGISGSGSSAFALWNKNDFRGFSTTLPWVEDVLVF
ncbi:MAG: 4-diphosphocytidyl-2C-methyl-D-erythritol kinase [Pyramidobacter sp.]|uniref:GHMP family kinase ATP-binding protein n=1 Tax=Pyramidobacter sp. TaxID=1943581 RepID=UPI002A824F5D|nr:4-diphosphocytidyl-2C-methyl-D-erythritol kinase [Pyramidobacter sp.]MDY4033009.1 4-diphosphocytidyl-2C-methyl-D-erythritol kinase [Pyramidobacter sp.]